MRQKLGREERRMMRSLVHTIEEALCGDLQEVRSQSAKVTREQKKEQVKFMLQGALEDLEATAEAIQKNARLRDRNTKSWQRAIKSAKKAVKKAQDYWLSKNGSEEAIVDAYGEVWHAREAGAAYMYYQADKAGGGIECVPVMARIFIAEKKMMIAQKTAEQLIEDAKNEEEQRGTAGISTECERRIECSMAYGMEGVSRPRNRD